MAIKKANLSLTTGSVRSCREELQDHGIGSRWVWHGCHIVKMWIGRTHRFGARFYITWGWCAELRNVSEHGGTAYARSWHHKGRLLFLFWIPVISHRQETYFGPCKMSWNVKCHQGFTGSESREPSSSSRWIIFYHIRSGQNSRALQPLCWILGVGPQWPTSKLPVCWPIAGQLAMVHTRRRIWRWRDPTRRCRSSSWAWRSSGRCGVGAWSIMVQWKSG